MIEKPYKNKLTKYAVVVLKSRPYKRHCSIMSRAPKKARENMHCNCAISITLFTLPALFTLGEQNKLVNEMSKRKRNQSQLTTLLSMDSYHILLIYFQGNQMLNGSSQLDLFFCFIQNTDLR